VKNCDNKEVISARISGNITFAVNDQQGVIWPRVADLLIGGAYQAGANVK